MTYQKIMNKIKPDENGVFRAELDIAEAAITKSALKIVEAMGEKASNEIAERMEKHKEIKEMIEVTSDMKYILLRNIYSACRIDEFCGIFDTRASAIDGIIKHYDAKKSVEESKDHEVVKELIIDHDLGEYQVKVTTHYPWGREIYIDKCWYEVVCVKKNEIYY